MLDILEKTESISKDNSTDLMFNFRKEYSPVEVKTQNLSNFDEENIKNQVQVVIISLNKKSIDLVNKNNQIAVCGKTMLEWVKNSVSDYSIKVVELDSEDDFLSAIKVLQIQKKYTVLLFDDTPLLKKNTVEDIVEYFVIKNLSVLKLKRGYMFETDYLSRIDKLLNPQEQVFNDEDFISVDDSNKYSLACGIMKNRIVFYHQKNGVLFENALAVQIDADVSIEAGAMIGPNVQLLGKTIVEGRVKINNSTIKDSVIKSNVVLNNCAINHSVIGNNCNIDNYCVIKDKSIIGDNCKMEGMNYVSHKTIEPNSVLSFGEKRS